MNLRQAYDGWSQQEQNRQLYVKTRDAFRRAWFTLPTNKPCSWYTKDVLALALAETRVVESDKVKAASVMIHVLTWANFAEPKYNPKPTFERKDVTRLIHLPADELEKERERITAAMVCQPEKPQPSEEDNDLDIDPVTALPQKAMAAEDAQQVADDADSLAGIDFDDKKQVADALMEQSERIMNDKPNEETNMNNEKKPRGKAPKPVAQIDPETLKVVKVWPSRCEAERQTGACNIDRCIAKHRMSAGYYWCMPEEADTFKPNPLSGNQPTKHNKKETSSASDIVAKNEQFKEDMKKLMPDAVPASVAAAAPLAKFKIGDHVWAKQPKELAVRTGYVISVDTSRMMYEVKYGAELWIVREDDLELVNEPVLAEYITKRKPESIAEYTNDELIAEMKRRGWKGNVTMTVSVDL